MFLSYVLLIMRGCINAISTKPRTLRVGARTLEWPDSRRFRA
jgi:hypothetical protein